MEFDDFLQAVTEQPAQQPSNAKPFEQVTVLGGGNDARLLAALCLSNGASVQLFSAYASELDAMRSGIALNGNGPVGRYHVSQEAGDNSQQHSNSNRAIVTTGSLDNCLVGAEVIFLTGPIHKQRTYAMVLADHLRDGQVLVVPNARTFGALEVSWLLKAGGCTADIVIAEMQGLPCFYQTDGTALDLQPAATAMACIPATETARVATALSPLLPNISTCNSVLHSSFADCSALVELPALLLGGPALSAGGPSIPMGAVPLPENESFLNLLGDQQLALAAQLFDERNAVARRFGVRDIPSFDTSLQIAAGNAKGDGRRFIPAQNEGIALIRDAVTGSLAPLHDAARVAGISAPATRSMLTLASSILGADLTASGRRLLSLGITSDDTDTVHTQLSSMAKHGLTHAIAGAAHP